MLNSERLIRQSSSWKSKQVTMLMAATVLSGCTVDGSPSRELDLSVDRSIAQDPAPRTQALPDMMPRFKSHEDACADGVIVLDRELQERLIAGDFNATTEVVLDLGLTAESRLVALVKIPDAQGQELASNDASHIVKNVYGAIDGLSDEKVEELMSQFSPSVVYAPVAEHEVILGNPDKACSTGKTYPV